MMMMRAFPAELPMPRPPEVASPQSAPTLAPDPAPALTSLLCEACMASCGALALQGANPYLTGENVSMQVPSQLPSRFANLR